MSGRPQFDRDHMIRLHAQGFDTAEIARMMGCHRNTVQRALTGQTNGTPTRPPARSTTTQQKEIDRIAQAAFGLAIAAHETADHLALPPDQDRHQLELWLRDLNAVLRSVKHLRNRLKENLA